MRHRSAVEIIRVDVKNLRVLLCRVVQRAQILVVCLGVANWRDAASDVWLNNSVHFEIAQQLHFQFCHFEHLVPRKQRRGHKVGGVKLVGLMAGRAEVFEDVGE